DDVRRSVREQRHRSGRQPVVTNRLGHGQQWCADPRLDASRSRLHLSSGYTDDMTSRAPVLDRLTALADPIRSRVLLLLEQHELAVGELCTILQLPQSTVSRHLKVLLDEGWVLSRGEGTTRFYKMIATRLDADARTLWKAVSGPMAA